MSARTHTRTRPAGKGVIGDHLPWWAVALPTLTFVALLLVLMSARPATSDPAFAHVLQNLPHLISHGR